MITGVLESKKIVSQIIEEPNTTIRGVASLFPDAASLASALNISTSIISLYEVSGDDVSCTISEDYVIPNGFLQDDTNIIEYDDKEGKVSFIGSYAFAASTIEYFNFPNWSSAGSQVFLAAANVKVKELKLSLFTTLPTAFIAGMGGVEYAHIPNATIWGGSTTADNVLGGFPSGGKLPNLKKVYVHPSLATSNAGGVEGDVQRLIDGGVEVSYVQNQIAPSAITDLSISDVYATVVKLDFTVPASSNAIEFYVVEVNGEINSRYKDADAVYAVNLSASSPTGQIVVRCIDIYGNESSSNPVATNTISTDATTDSTNFVANNGVSDGATIEAIHKATLRLKISKIWDSAKGIYPFIGSSFSEFQYDLKGDYNLTETTAGTYANNTLKGGNLNTGILPSELIDNNYHISFYSLEDIGGYKETVSAFQSGSKLIWLLTQSPNIFNQGYANTGAGTTNVNAGGVTGLLTIERDGPAQKIYRNGELKRADNDGVSGTKPTIPFEIKSQLKGCFTLIGNALSADQNKELYSIINELNTVIGR